MPLLLSLTIFLAWWVIGLAVLAGARADLGSLRVALTAPAVGTAAILLPFFVCSYAGLGMHAAAPGVTIALVAGAAIVLATRRPLLPAGIVPVVGISVAGMLLAAWPFFKFGFSWVSYANDDMANYALSATYLLGHGLLAQVDFVGLMHNVDYPSVSAGLHRSGSRPGADIILAGLSALTGRAPAQMFMPLIVALGMVTVCSAAALAMQAATRWWVASVAAVVAVLSPQGTFGMLAELMPQVWGLGLACALFALLMRPELHRRPGPSVSDVVPIALIGLALFVVYVELASTVVVAYGIYIFVLALRRDLDLRAVWRLWVPAVLLVAVVANRYGLTELQYLRSQADVGLHGSSALPGTFTGPPQWGYTLVPSALPGILGLIPLPPDVNNPHLQFLIVVAIVLLFAVAVVTIVTAWRGVAAAVALVAYGLLGAVLGARSDDFGLYKVYMYVQPFLAASVAVWLSMIGRNRVAMIALTSLLAVVGGLQIATQQVYVRASRSPAALRNASARSILPVFRKLASPSGLPVVSVTDNPTLAKLEAAENVHRPLLFMSQNLFSATASRAADVNGWEHRTFTFPGGSNLTDGFWENAHATAALSKPGCRMILPVGQQSVVNARYLANVRGDLVARPCGALSNTLVFTASDLGWGYYAFVDRRNVGVYPPESDSFRVGRAMSGFGRYSLFRVINPSKAFRVELTLTTTYLRMPLPPGTVVGAGEARLPLVGYGSARVVSAPLSARTVDGQSYILLDLGRNGTLIRSRDQGITGLYGRGVPLDPRYLAAFVRNISLVPADVKPNAPRVLSGFPHALANPDLRYSGIYEDGWLAKRSYVVLAGGNRGSLTLRATVPAPPGGQTLRVLVNGREVARRQMNPGLVTLHVPLPASLAERKVELDWSYEYRLPRGDGRPVGALLQFLGVESAGGS